MVCQGSQKLGLTRWRGVKGWNKRRRTFSGPGTSIRKARLEGHGALATANGDELTAVITACIRAYRFCDGALDTPLENGLILRVVIRAKELVR